MKTNSLTKILSAAAVVAMVSASSSVFAQVKVGNNPNVISPSAALEIESTNKGLLLPRVTLQSTTDVTTIPSPAKGLMIYNTATAGSGNTAVKADQVYFWNGNFWDITQTQASQTASGVTTKKLLQRSQWPDETKTLVVEDIEFRLLYSAGSGGADAGGIIQGRLVTPPPATIAITTFLLSMYDQDRYAARPAPFQFLSSNSWVNVAAYPAGVDTGTINQTGEVRNARFAYNGKVYIVEGFASGPAGADNTWVLIVNVY